MWQLCHSGLIIIPTGFDWEYSLTLEILTLTLGMQLLGAIYLGLSPLSLALLISSLSLGLFSLAVLNPLLDGILIVWHELGHSMGGMM